MITGLLMLLLTPHAVLAVTRPAPTLTATPPPAGGLSPTPTLTNLDEIQKIREVVQQKVQEKLKEIINPTAKKGYLGKVSKVNPTSLTIESPTASHDFTLNADIVYVDLKRNKTDLSHLKVGQDILVMGIENNTDKSFDVKRIVFTDLNSVYYKKTVVTGKIVDISRSSPIFTLIPPKNKNALFQIKTDSKTDIVSQNNKKLKIGDITSGHKLIAVLIPDEKISNSYTALKLIDLDYSPVPSPAPTLKK